MKVLVVCSANARNDQGDFDFIIHQAFIYEQIKAVEQIYHINYVTFFIKGKGVFGYIKNIIKLNKFLFKNNDISLIHAHNSVVGLLCLCQFFKPVVVTFHGSDVNKKSLNYISSVVSFFAKHCIFVSNYLFEKILLKPVKKYAVIPCGIDTTVFKPINKSLAQQTLGLSESKKYILFSSAFDNTVKNFPLAQQAITKLQRTDIELLEIKNRTREEVCLLINSSDLVLMTSFSEGSPQIVKEALACNCPVVSTNVGDVKDVFGEIEGYYMSSFDAMEISNKITLALAYSASKGRTNGSDRIIELGLDNESVAKKIVRVYEEIIGLQGKNVKG